MHYWNNLHQYAQSQNIGKPNNSKIYEKKKVLTWMVKHYTKINKLKINPVHVEVHKIQHYLIKLIS